MSRIGKQLIEIPAGVTVEVAPGLVRVKGPKGAIERTLPSRVSVIVENETVHVDVPDKERADRAIWGTYASHVKNMVLGVTKGFQKQLEVNGVGYRVGLQGKDLKLEVGFSHPVVFPMPEGVTATVEKNMITISGINKEVVGDTAAKVREIRKPEPYKGKGIKYSDEILRHKAGKAAGKGATAAA